MQTVLQDVKYAFRLMGRHRGFSAAAIATLGLGIGASALAFTVIDATPLRPVPYSDPDQLVRIRIERPVDGPVLGLVAATLLLACCLPARRAARVDPLIALRYE